VADESDRKAKLRERLEREAEAAEHTARVPGRTTLVQQLFEPSRAPVSNVPGKATLVSQHLGIDVQRLVAEGYAALAGAADRDHAYSALVDALATHGSEIGLEHAGEVMSVCIQLLSSKRVPAAAKATGQATVQRRSTADHAGTDRAADVATHGVASAGAPLPHLDRIQASFGRHDVSHVRTQTGGAAADSSRVLGASAYAVGDRVGFAGSPDLHTAAHEAAHVVQQQGGVHLKGGIDGGKTDPLEQHADTVADAVVRGESAEALLDPFSGKGSASATVQRKADPDTPGAALQPPTWEYCNTYRVKIVAAIADRIRAVGLPKPHPRLYWAVREKAEQAFIDVIWKDIELLQRQTLHRLMEHSQPVDLYTLVDGVRQGGTAKQLADWHPVVGVVIANAMTEPLDSSIQRMAMRLRVQLDGPAHGNPQNAHLVPSCPLDVLVAEALTKPGVIGGGERKASVDDTPGKQFLRGAEPVQFRLLGQKDPKLWNWIEVTSPKNATVEDVASTQLIAGKEDSVMGPAQAYRIAASPPYFGLPIEVARQIDDMRQHATGGELIDADQGKFGRVADAGVLHKSMASDDAAIAQAPPPEPHTPGLDRLLGRVDVQLAAIETRLARVKAAGLIVGAKDFAGRCRGELSRDPKKAGRFVPAVAAQEGILHTVSSELVDLFTALDNRRTKTPGEQLPASISDLIRAFASAAGASHLAAEATPLLAQAMRQKALMPLSVIDDEIRSARDVVGSQGETEEKGADDNVHALPSVMTQAADLRLRLSRGEKVTSGEVSQTNSDASELTTRARLTSLASTVRALKDKADSVGLSAQKSPGGSWSVAMLTTMVLDLIYEEEKAHSQFEGADKLHGGWLKRLEIAKTNGAKDKHDPNAEMQAAVKYINGELASMDAQLGTLKEFIKWCNKEIADQELKNLLQSIAWQMGLMIVTGEIAGAGLAAIRGVALAGEIAEDVRGASLLWRGAEVLTHAALQTAASGATGGEISGSAFAENALGMLLTSAAMKPFKALLEGDAVLEQTVEKELTKLGKIGKVVKTGAKIGTEAAIDLGAGVIGSGVARSVVHNTPMGIGSRDEWMQQGFALAASAFVSAHTQAMHSRIELAAHEFRAAKMTDAAEQLDALAVRAEALRTKAASKKQPTPEEAGTILLERHGILTEERALYQKFGGAKAEGKQNAAELAATSSGFIDVPFQLAGLSPVVDGLSYEGTSKQIKKALDSAKANGIEPSGTQDEKGVWTLKVGDRVLTVKELDFKAGQPHEHVWPPAHEAATQTQTSTPSSAPESKVARPSEQLAVETDADGRIAIAGDDALLRSAAERAQPEPGYVDVVVHSDGDSFYVVRGDADVALTHRSLAKALEKAGIKKPARIRLLACEGGRDPAAVAQHLANKTGLDVLAPTKKVWVDKNGTVGIGERNQHQGEWKPFEPGKAVPMESKRVLVKPEEGAHVDPHARDHDPIVHSEHDHRDRVEDWNHDQLQAQIGKPLILDASLHDGVSIKVRKVDGGYEVTGIHYGPDARAMDVVRHGEIVARIERYNGLVGKVRRWKESLFGARRGAGEHYAAGSRGDRLHIELDKLEQHIRDTNIMRSNDAIDAARAERELEYLTDAVAEIREELDDKVDLHAHDAEFDVNRPPTLGYITQKAKAAGYKLPGEPGATIEGVTLDSKNYYYRRHADGFELVRYDDSKGPKVEVVHDSAGGFAGVRLSPEEGRAETKLIDIKYEQAHDLLFAGGGSMGPYAQMLEHLGIADRATVEAKARQQYQKLTGANDKTAATATIDTWRHGIKEEYRREVERRLFEPELSDAESYRRLRDAVDLLGNKDRAILVEGWYRARRLQGMDVKAQAQYTVTRTSGAQAGHKETRNADFFVGKDKLHGKEIVELKDIEGKIDEEQFGAYADLLHDDNLRARYSVESLRYVFTKPEGAVANLEFLADAYDKSDLHGLMTIEVYMNDGSHRVATTEKDAMDILRALRGY